MLVNRMEFNKKFEEVLKGDEFGNEGNIVIERKNKWIKKVLEDIRVPMIYRGLYEVDGKYTVWNEVGGIEAEGLIYRPVKGGTVLYEV